MECLRRDFQAGEHEALWSALKIVYDSNFPMPKWLYEAVIKRLRDSETDRETQYRLRRVRDISRAGYVLLHIEEGRKAGRKAGVAFVDASEEMKRWGFAGSPSPDAVEDSWKKTGRIRRQFKRKKEKGMKKVPK
jgi:hypothetical protein